MSSYDFHLPIKKSNFQKHPKRRPSLKLTVRTLKTLGLDDEIPLWGPERTVSFGECNNFHPFRISPVMVAGDKGSPCTTGTWTRGFWGVVGGGENQSFRMTKIRQNWGFVGFYAIVFWMGEDMGGWVLPWVFTMFHFYVYNLPNQEMNIFQESWVILGMIFSDICFQDGHVKNPPATS